MKRRDFITLLGGAAMAWPIAARAQQVSVVGFLGSASPETYSAFLTALRQGLSDAGSVELRNYRIEFRWAFDQFDRLPALAAELGIFIVEETEKWAKVVRFAGIKPE
jgi:putative tryptophan/tyrosine transport system substrate-binding protein